MGDLHKCGHGDVSRHNNYDSDDNSHDNCFIHGIGHRFNCHLGQFNCPRNDSVDCNADIDGQPTLPDQHKYLHLYGDVLQLVLHNK